MLADILDILTPQLLLHCPETIGILKCTSKAAREECRQAIKTGHPRCVVRCVLPGLTGLPDEDLQPDYYRLLLRNYFRKLSPEELEPLPGAIRQTLQKLPATNYRVDTPGAFLAYAMKTMHAGTAHGRAEITRILTEIRTEDAYRDHDENIQYIIDSLATSFVVTTGAVVDHGVRPQDNCSYDNCYCPKDDFTPWRRQ